MLFVTSRKSIAPKGRSYKKSGAGGCPTQSRRRTSRRKPGVPLTAVGGPDPFDRLLVAQAIIEPLRLLTHDATLAPYSDTILLV
jgi:hypothetical protein